jgi:hypothetical protein
MSPSDGEVNVSSDSRIRIKKDKDSRFFKSEYSVFPEFEFSIDAQGGEVLIVPSEKLKQGTEYSVHVKNMYVSNDNLGKSAESVYDIQMYQFKTADPVNIASVSPSPAGERASIHSEIAIEFNKQVRYEEAENAFSIEPSVDGDFGWEGSTLVFNPKEELASPQEYTVRIAEGVSSYVDNGVLEEDYVFTFNSKRHEKEIDPDEELIPEIVEGKYIDVDLGSQYLTLFEDGISKGTFQISSGRYDLPTPRGTFNIINKVPLAYSNQYDLYMPFWMAFTYAGHGFHELPFWKYRSGYEYKERESNLGTPVSHGCVRLGVGPAEIAYNFADIGTPIVIHD